jgi:glycosyltransferase involved in cell wall biosynthesis
MKILITCDPEIPVPPINYGGIERIVSSLSQSYKKKGHQVILLANPDSTEVSADMIIGWKGLKSRGLKNIILNSYRLYKVVKKYKPDIIHSFSRLFYLFPIFLFSKTKVVQTYQRKISSRTTNLAKKIAGKKIQFTSCAAHMHKGFENPERWHTMFNFTDTNYFIYNPDIKTEYLLFLGRIEDIKGTKECIDVAIATKNKLIIAGNIQPGHDEYFNTNIKPHFENPLIEYVGPVNDEQKLHYLQHSKAFLFPIKWEEPFGIVMAEALACGVPVIGFNRGSVPEVVIHGKTGFIVNTMDEMVEAISKINTIDRSEVRKDCVNRFSVEVIAEQYLGLFKKV